MTTVPALVEPAFRPTKIQLAALRRLATTTYKRGLRAWRATPHPDVSPAVVHDLRLAGLVEIRFGISGAQIADVTAMGRHVIAWYSTHPVARRR
jgi:hypothetical protein